jgi:hypothetical protein
MDTCLPSVSHLADTMNDNITSRRLQREIERLLTRVLDLDTLLHHDAAFDAQRAADLKKQIKAKQKRLTVLYDQIE